MFENLTQKIQGVFNKLRGRGKLTEQEVNAALREVRLALLEADVNYKVAKEFISRVAERAVGQEVLEHLDPVQQVIKIVYEELVHLLGDIPADLQIVGAFPAIIMMVGLQGGGKTTTCGKLAYLLRKRGRKPLLVAADVYRPAAIRQLQVLGQSLNIPVFSLGEKTDPVDISRASLSFARQNRLDTVILDTAGRLHVDEALMEELERIRQEVQPQEILLVLDAMTGQDAVNVAQAFNERVPLTGFILTKLDGDARGGAALSLRAVTHAPIKFIGVGEQLEALEPFYPDRMASRILGMGDVLTLIERAESAWEAKQIAELEEKLRQNRFDLEDYLQQLEQITKMGPLDQILSLIPGLGAWARNPSLEADERAIRRQRAIIQSMTKEERKHPEIINGSRRRRIARGSGTSVQEVNRLLHQFEQMRQVIRQFSEMEKGRRKGSIRLPFLG